MTLRSVGVVVDTGPVPGWHRTAIELLAESGAAVSVHRAPPGAGAERPPALLRRIAAWERRRLGATPPALARAALAEPPGPLDAADGLDLVVWLAAAPVPAGLAQRLPLGAWYLAQGHARTPADCPLLREVLAGAGHVETKLWSFDGERHTCLLTAVGTVDRYSYLRSLARASAKAAQLPSRMLSRMDGPRAGGPNVSDGVTAPPVRTGPGPARTAALGPARLAARVALRVLLRRTSKLLLAERWTVAWRAVERPATGIPTGDARYTLLEADAGHYYADPFPLSHDGRRFLFVEDFSQATGRGSIAVVELSGDGPPAVTPVLDLDTHLSYPFVMRHEGELYLLPENRHASRLVLWRAREFPASWELAQAMFEEEPFADATLRWHDGRVWLFAAVSFDDGAPVDELSVFYADTLDGPWTAHPLNPVVSDVRRARPAGPIFDAGDGLVRPAQDCSRAYGWRTVFNRIDVLTPEDYRETPVAVATPIGWRARRTHTFARDGELEAVDVLVARPRLAPRAWRDRPRAVLMRFSRL